MKRNTLMGVDITNASQEEILEYIVEKIETTKEKFYVVTPNPEIIVYANSHTPFKKILNQAQISLCDGVGVSLAGMILGKPFKSRVTGVDVMEHLCRLVSRKPITVGLLGAGPKIAEITVECLVRKYPGLRVTFAASELSQSSLRNEEVSSIKYKVYRKDEKSSIFNTKYLIPNTDILFVAYGFPKQEEWMSAHLPNLPIRVAIGVGGAFDYISKVVPRAPRIFQTIGLEWLYRLIHQPWRIKRQLALITFMFLVVKELFNKK